MKASGAILPAGSPLVQFEVTANAHGGYLEELPRIIWVDRNPSRSLEMKVFTCGGPGFGVYEPDIIGMDHIVRAAVCRCMGHFIE
jgi:hypothetical protein